MQDGTYKNSAATPHICRENLGPRCVCQVCGKVCHSLEDDNRGSGTGLAQRRCTRCGASESYYDDTGTTTSCDLWPDGYDPREYKEWTHADYQKTLEALQSTGEDSLTQISTTPSLPQKQAINDVGQNETAAGNSLPVNCGSCKFLSSRETYSHYSDLDGFVVYDKRMICKKNGMTIARFSTEGYLSFDYGAEDYYRSVKPDNCPLDKPWQILPIFRIFGR